jgi:hypothetical protein
MNLVSEMTSNRSTADDVPAYALAKVSLAIGLNLLVEE